MPALAAILALALGLRVFAWQRAAMMMNDGPNFLWQAQRLLEGDWQAAWAHPYHPLYAALTALVEPLAGDLVTAAVAVSIGSGLLLCVAAWGLARRAFPELPGAATGAALVAAVNTRCLDVTADVQADGPFAALAACSLWALLAAAQRGGCRRRIVLAGALAGAAYLVRAEGLFLLLGPGLWVLGGGPQPALARRMQGALLFGSAVLVAVLPYAFALRGVTGQWCLSLKPSMANLGLGPSGPAWQAPPDSPLGWPLVPSEEDALDRPGRPAPRGELRQGSLLTLLPQVAPPPDVRVAPPPRPALLAALHASSVRLGFALRGETIVLVVPGLALLWQRRRRLALATLVLLAGWVAACALQVHKSHFLVNRHMILAVALALPLAGAGLARMWAGHVALRVLAILCLVVAAGAGTRAQREHHEPRLAALAWVQAHTSPAQAFVTHRQRDGFYAQRRAITAQIPVYDDILRSRLREHDAPYLVLNAADVAAHEPHWLANGLMVEVARFGEGEDAVAVYEQRFGPP